MELVVSTPPFFKLILIVESIADVPPFSLIDCLYPTPAPLQAFSALLSVPMGYPTHLLSTFQGPVGFAEMNTSSCLSSRASHSVRERWAHWRKCR